MLKETEEERKRKMGGDIEREGRRGGMKKGRESTEGEKII